MADGTKKTLLVVDDDRAVRKLLERVALRAGFDVDTAKDGQHAIEMLEAKSYEIVIVDLMMPRVSGYELVERIQAFNPRPTVLVATAMANGDVARLDDSLVRRVIRKPFDIEAVAKVLIETATEIAERNAIPGAPNGVVQAIIPGDAKLGAGDPPAVSAAPADGEQQPIKEASDPAKEVS